MEALLSIEPARAPLRGRLTLPGDKSIAHRAVLFNALAAGRAMVRGLPDGEDVASTIAAVRQLGVDLERSGEECVIVGRRMRLAAPAAAIDCGNSGTTMRLLVGVLAGQRFEAVLDGDESLRQRPMERVARPLRLMGARVVTTSGHPPVRIVGGLLRPADFELDVASAQVKTALLLAAMQAEGRSSVSEPLLSRDHSERMLASMGVVVDRAGSVVRLEGPVVPSATDIDIPGDPSSAAFFLAAAAIVPGSDLTVDGICLNPTRTGYLDVLGRMGADLVVTQRGESGGEVWGDVRIRHAPLRGVVLGAEDIPSTIDEIPVLAVVAACASGRTTIGGARELRVKETDRITATVRLLSMLGVAADERSDGMAIEGTRLRGGTVVDSGGDHRIAMAAAVAGLVCAEPIRVAGARAVTISYPRFFEELRRLGR